jgi:hypothetical protein
MDNCEFRPFPFTSTFAPRPIVGWSLRYLADMRVAYAQNEANLHRWSRAIGTNRANPTAWNWADRQPTQFINCVPIEGSKSRAFALISNYQRNRQLFQALSIGVVTF